MDNLYKSIFQNNPEAILIIDPYQNKIIKANNAALTLFSFFKELHQCTATQIFAPSLAKLYDFTEEVINKGDAWSNELKSSTQDDESIELETSAVLLNDAIQPLISFTLRDKKNLNRLNQITEANQLHRDGLEHWQTIENVFREFERQNQLILNAVGEGIFGVDTDGNTTFANPAAERILGWQASELIGNNMHDMIHHSYGDGSHYHNKDCHIYAAFRVGEVRYVDNEMFWKKNGNPIQVEYTSTPILDNGRLAGAVIIFKDISDRKLAEEKLHAALNEVHSLKQKLELENAYLQEEYLSEHNYKEIVGNSAAIHKIIQQIELVSPTDANVLISGESGTGKELISRAIHESSYRKNRPLIRVNCASIPRELFESEFFGHVKGAFTGAINDRAGRFELADGGTIFLDEVGEIPIELQSKLLRVIQEQQFERVGESKTRSVNVRIIAATNRDLKQEVQDKHFREDLYFRLNVFPIESPALRERHEDIPLLANHFLKIACKKFSKPTMTFTLGNIEKLKNYPWPGNIRELVNVIEQGVILSNNKHLTLNLPNHSNVKANITVNKQSIPFIQTKDELINLEKQSIINALKHTNGKIFGANGAAELLNTNPTTLCSRIKKHKINRHQYIQLN